MAGSEVRRLEIWGIAIAAVVILGVLPALERFRSGNAIHFTFRISRSISMASISPMRSWRSGSMCCGASPVCLASAMPFLCARRLCFGMYLMLKIGKLGQYKSDLPDFMVFLGYQHAFPRTGFRLTVSGLLRRRSSGLRHRRVGFRLSRVSLADPRRLLFDPDPGSYLRRVPDVLSKRLYLRRQQRIDRLQVRSRLRCQ